MNLAKNVLISEKSIRMIQIMWLTKLLANMNGFSLKIINLKLFKGNAKELLWFNNEIIKKVSISTSVSK